MTNKQIRKKKCQCLHLYIAKKFIPGDLVSKFASTSTASPDLRYHGYHLDEFGHSSLGWLKCEFFRVFLSNSSWLNGERKQARQFALVGTAQSHEVRLHFTAVMASISPLFCDDCGVQLFAKRLLRAIRAKLIRESIKGCCERLRYLRRTMHLIEFPVSLPANLGFHTDEQWSWFLLASWLKSKIQKSSQESG